MFRNVKNHAGWVITVGVIKNEPSYSILNSFALEQLSRAQSSGGSTTELLLQLLNKNMATTEVMCWWQSTAIQKEEHLEKGSTNKHITAE